MIQILNKEHRMYIKLPNKKLIAIGWCDDALAIEFIEDEPTPPLIEEHPPDKQ